MLVYISGPYRDNTDAGISENIENARKAAIEIWELGYPMVAICPHLNTAHFERDAEISHNGYIAGDLMILARCDCILMLPDWERSEGSNIEKKFAEVRDIPVYYYPKLP